MAGVLVVQCGLQCGVELFPLQPEGPDVECGEEMIKRSRVLEWRREGW